MKIKNFIKLLEKYKDSELNELTVNVDNSPFKTEVTIYSRAFDTSEFIKEVVKLSCGEGK